MSLIAHYKLNDNAANTSVADASGNAYAGTAARNTNLTASVGKVGGAYNANGSTDYATIANQTPFNFEYNQPFSVACWVKPNITRSGGASFYALVSKTDAGFKGWEMVLNWNYTVANKVIFYVFVGNALSVAIWKDGSIDIPNGLWTHLAFSYTGSGTAAGVTLYVNGVADAGSIRDDNLASNTIRNTTPLVIAASNGGGYACPGAFDDVRIYNDALTASQIRAIYNAGMGSDRPYPWQPRIVVPTLLPLRQKAA